MSNDWRTRTLREVRRGGWLYVILHTGKMPCREIQSRPGMRYFTLLPVYLDTPSSDAVKSGWYADALLPRNSDNCHLSPLVLAEWQPDTEQDVTFTSEHQQLVVQVRFSGHFVAPRRDLLIGLSYHAIEQGHCASACQVNPSLLQQYQTLLRQHHIQPFHHWILPIGIQDTRLDIDAGQDNGYSFRQTHLASRPNWVAFPRAQHYPDPIAYLRALENTVVAEHLQGKAWVLVKDEPDNIESLIPLLALYRTYAPSVMTAVTTRFDPRLQSLVDIFVPLIHQLDKPQLYQHHRLWSYTSCMHSCGPNRRISQQRNGSDFDTGMADFLIDRPLARLNQFFLQQAKWQTDAALYYHAVEGYLLTPGVDIFSDPYNFGGNGDGLLLYPGRKGERGLQSDQPLASLRLKAMRRAIEQYW
ncbi:hypothetical protein TK45_04435 [Bowmanella sp. JS7-9]|nr:hypothetical protein TK45_04435 [Bowmanella sp. JS7-9]